MLRRETSHGKDIDFHPAFLTTYFQKVTTSPRDKIKYIPTNAQSH